MEEVQYQLYEQSGSPYTETLWPVKTFSVSPSSMEWNEVINEAAKQGYKFEADKLYALRYKDEWGGIFVFRVTSVPALQVQVEAV